MIDFSLIFFMWMKLCPCIPFVRVSFFFCIINLSVKESTEFIARGSYKMNMIYKISENERNLLFAFCLRQSFTIRLKQTSTRKNPKTSIFYKTGDLKRHLLRQSWQNLVFLKKCGFKRTKILF